MSNIYDGACSIIVFLPHRDDDHLDVDAPGRNSSADNSTSRQRRDSGRYYAENASFTERNFLAILAAIALSCVLCMLYVCYCCCCAKGLCPCLKCCTDSAVNKWMIGAEVDANGNIHYRELTEEELEVIEEIKEEFA